MKTYSLHSRYENPGLHGTACTCGGILDLTVYLNRDHKREITYTCVKCGQEQKWAWHPLMEA